MITPTHEMVLISEAVHRLTEKTPDAPILLFWTVLIGEFRVISNVSHWTTITHEALRPVIGYTDFFGERLTAYQVRAMDHITRINFLGSLDAMRVIERIPHRRSGDPLDSPPQEAWTITRIGERVIEAIETIQAIRNDAKVTAKAGTPEWAVQAARVAQQRQRDYSVAYATREELAQASADALGQLFKKYYHTAIKL